MKITVIDYLELFEVHTTTLQGLGKVTIYDDIPQTEAETIQRIAEAELAIATLSEITETVIQKASSLKYIVIPGVGYDHVNIQAATAAGVKVINCPTHNARAVAEYTIGLIFTTTRKIAAAHLMLRSGTWNSNKLLGTELQGKQLGLIGYGSIGQEVARLAIALGMQVSYTTSSSSNEEIDQLVANADILSLHIPLTPKSRILLNDRRLNLMKPSAYLINTARGAIVDSQALIATLREKRIAGAALDVFESEPTSEIPSQSILELARLDNVVATPHIAYNSEEAMMRLGEELIDNVQACIQGCPTNRVN